MARKLSSVRTLILGLMLALAFGLFLEPASAQQFITFNYPGGTNCGPNLINNLGAMTGSCIGTVDGFNGINGFVLQNGQYTALDFPGSLSTWGGGINDLSQVVGGYVDSQGVEHGFLLSGATYSTLNFPGAKWTALISINNSGQMVGEYANAGSSVVHGFSVTAGVFTTIDFPGGHLINAPNQVNNFGVIAGWYADIVGGNYILHGYVYKAEIFSPINFPGASSTAVNAINDGGELSGAFTGTTASGGFTYINGQFTTVNFPATTGVIDNLALNNSGQLAAAYEDPEANFHGAVSAIGPFAYVPSLAEAVVSVYDTASSLLLTTIPVGAHCDPNAISPDGKYVYVSNNFGNSVSVINTASNAVVATIPVGVGPDGIAFSPDSSLAYVVNGGNAISVIDTASKVVTSTFLTASNPSLLAVSPDGKFLYITFELSNNVSVVSTATHAVVANVIVGPNPFDIAITPNGKFAYVTVTFANSVAVIDTSTNTVAANIPVGARPLGISISQDGTTAYVSNSSGGDISVINLRSNSVVATIPVGGMPNKSALTPDGAFLWTVNDTDPNNISVLQTATNSVLNTLPVNDPTDVVIGSAPQPPQSISQPLSPTAPNTFNFGPHNFTVQYPAGTSFSGVSMTVAAAQATQAGLRQRFAGTPFANATCIIYSGAGGNCVDYQVTCSTTGGSQITCPNESSPTISVKTSYDTLQQIINPGFLTTPIGTNEWMNIFTAFYLQRIDPTTKGRTSGFSEFVAVDLGATNSQGAGTLQLLPPLQQNDARVFPVGTLIPVEFQLKSIAQPSQSITDATAGITVVMTRDANGNPTSTLLFGNSSAFTYTGGNYVYSLNTSGYAPGTYNITVYGNAFAAQQVQFTLPAPISGAHLITTLQSLTLNTVTNKYVATVSVSNTGTGAANGLIVTASELNATATSTVLPVSLGDISSNSSATVTLTYAASAGAAGSRGVWTISESFAGGSTGAGTRVVLP